MENAISNPVFQGAVRVGGIGLKAAPVIFGVGEAKKSPE